MKTLKKYIGEGILAGREKTKARLESDIINTLVKKWAEENLTLPFGENMFKIDDNGKIINKDNNSLNLSKVTNIPEYIKFGDIDGNVYFGSETLKQMSQEQLPTCQSTMFIGGKTGTIPSFVYTCNSFYINDFPQYIKHIEPITLKMNSKGYRKPTISLDNTNIQLSDLLNIKVEGDVYSLYIKKTPAAEQIKKEIKKLDKKGEKTGECLYIKYLDDLFKNFPGLRFIYLSERTTLEHNPNTLQWYLF
jgi:hypothetical protein